MFATVMHHLKSPENVGMIVRTHVAFGGEKLIVVGPDPWRLKKRAQGFSRRLEKVTEMLHVPDDDAFFAWCEAERYVPVAIEIAEAPVYLPGFVFPERPAVIVGNEAKGLPKAFLERCAHVLTIPQFGRVRCLNTAVSCSIALYELNRTRPVDLAVAGSKYDVDEGVGSR